MNTAIVWLLIAVSDGGYNHGTATNLGMFPTQGDCEWVRKHIPNASGGYPDVKSACIQAKIVAHP